MIHTVGLEEKRDWDTKETIWELNKTINNLINKLEPARKKAYESRYVINDLEKRFEMIKLITEEKDKCIKAIINIVDLKAKKC